MTAIMAFLRLPSPHPDDRHHHGLPDPQAARRLEAFVRSGKLKQSRLSFCGSPMNDDQGGKKQLT
jgi:hypothetical protein